MYMIKEIMKIMMNIIGIKLVLEISSQNNEEIDT